MSNEMKATITPLTPIGGSFQPSGPAGVDGEDGFSPTLSVTDIPGGHRLTITDANGSHTVDIMDGLGAVDSVNGKTGAVVLALSDLDDDETHRTVTDEEKAAWDGKSDFSGDYNDLENKPTIPTVPTQVSAFNNDAGYLTQHQDISGKLDTTHATDTEAHPGLFAPADHASQHASGGSDPIAPASIGAAGLDAYGKVIQPQQYQSNPNLLHNWYFANPVNQRGQTEYREVAYTIDRWKLSTSNMAVSFSSDGFSIGAGGEITQYFEDIPAFDGKEMTASIMVNGVLYSTTFTYNAGNGWTRLETYDCGWSTGYSGQGKYYRLSNRSGVSTDVVLATKLELGTQQTLAHQDADGNWVLNEIPNKSEELIRCQCAPVDLDGGGGLLPVEYRIVDGVKEWINPPMLLGVEYRTTERYEGKPVYKKLCSYTFAEEVGSDTAMTNTTISMGLGQSMTALVTADFKMILVSDTDGRARPIPVSGAAGNTVMINAILLNGAVTLILNKWKIGGGTKLIGLFAYTKE